MRISPKGIILFFVVLLPTLLFVFLKFYGVNYYDLPVYYENGIDSVAFDCGNQKEQHFVDNFSFTTHDGDKFGASFLEEKITVISFFYAKCGTPCDDENEELSRVYNFYKNYPSFQILSVSLNPAVDSLALIKTYATSQKRDETRWYFVRWDMSGTLDFVNCGLAIKLAKDKYGMPFTSQMVLLDEQKRIRGYYDATNRSDIDRLVTEVSILESNLGAKDK